MNKTRSGREFFATVASVIAQSAFISCFSISAACADVSAKELQVVGRCLGFVKNAATGGKLAVIVDSKKSESVAEGDSIMRALSGGLKVGAMTLSPYIVKLEDLAGAKDVAAYFLTSGVGTDAAALKSLAKETHIPCATTDIQQVQNGTCIIGVKVDPKVQILVNKASAIDDGITLDDAFKMLITEI